MVEAVVVVVAVGKGGEVVIVSINIILMVRGEELIRVLIDVLPSPTVEFGSLRASSLTS